MPTIEDVPKDARLYGERTRGHSQAVLDAIERAYTVPKQRWVRIKWTYGTRAGASSTASNIWRGFLRLKPRADQPSVEKYGQPCLAVRKVEVAYGSLDDGSPGFYIWVKRP